MQGWKGKEGDGSCYCHKIRWWWQEWWVVLEWLNFPKCLGIILLKVCLESCYVMAKKKKNPSKFFLTCEKTACALTLLLGWFWSSSLGTTEAGGSFSWSLLLVAELCPSHQKFVIVISTEIEWCEKSQNISLMFTSRRRSYVSSGIRKASPSKGHREIWNYRAAAVQGWSESCGLINSGRIIAFPQFQGCLHSVYAITVGIYPHRILF